MTGRHVVPVDVPAPDRSAGNDRAPFIDLGPAPTGRVSKHSRRGLAGTSGAPRQAAIDRHRVFGALAYLGMLVLLLVTLRAFIVPYYGYAGFYWAPSAAKLLEAAAAAAIGGWLLPRSVRKPSDLYLHVHFLFPVLPMLALYASSDQSRSFTWSVLAAFALLCALAERARPHALRVGRVPPRHVMTLLLCAASAIVAAIIAFGGMSYWNLDLFRVYEFRGATWRQLPPVFGYLAPLASKVLIPAALLLALLYRMRLAAAAALVLAVVLFGLTSHKDVLVYPLAVIGLYFLLGRTRPLRVLLGGFVACVALAMLSWLLSGPRDVLGNIGVRRGVLLPALMTYWYHDFFSERALMLWSQSRITFGLVESAYRLPGSIMLGIEYYASETSNLTTGWIGTGYMNGGTAGLFLYAALVGLFLAYLNRVAEFVDLRAVVAISAAPTLTLFLSSDLPTAMLNHGGLLVLGLFSVLEIRRRAVGSDGGPSRRTGSDTRRWSPARSRSPDRDASRTGRRAN